MSRCSGSTQVVLAVLEMLLWALYTVMDQRWQRQIQSTDKLVSLGGQNKYQHIQRSTYLLEIIKIKKV